MNRAEILLAIVNSLRKSPWLIEELLDRLLYDETVD